MVFHTNSIDVIGLLLETLIITIFRVFAILKQFFGFSTQNSFPEKTPIFVLIFEVISESGKRSQTTATLLLDKLICSNTLIITSPKYQGHFRYLSIEHQVYILLVFQWHPNTKYRVLLLLIPCQI